MSTQSASSRPPAGAPRPPGARRATRVSGDEREAAILTTAEELLARSAYADISVDDLARGAGISRPTFYFYFVSKDAVLLALLSRAITKAEQEFADVFTDADPDPDPSVGWRRVIAGFFHAFGQHPAVVAAAVQARATAPEIGATWSASMQGWVTGVALRIDAERASGAAPSGVASRDLAAALCLLNERTLQGVFLAEQPAVDPANVIDVLLHIWLQSIYGAAVTTPSS